MKISERETSLPHLLKELGRRRDLVVVITCDDLTPTSDNSSVYVVGNKKDHYYDMHRLIEWATSKLTSPEEDE